MLNTLPPLTPEQLKVYDRAVRWELERRAHKKAKGTKKDSVSKRQMALIEKILDYSFRLGRPFANIPSLSDFVELTGISKPNVWRTLRELEARDALLVHGIDDGRAKETYYTIFPAVWRWKNMGPLATSDHDARILHRQLTILNGGDPGQMELLKKDQDLMDALADVSRDEARRFLSRSAADMAVASFGGATADAGRMARPPGDASPIPPRQPESNRCGVTAEDWRDLQRLIDGVANPATGPGPNGGGVANLATVEGGTLPANPNGRCQTDNGSGGTGTGVEMAAVAKMTTAKAASPTTAPFKDSKSFSSFKASSKKLLTPETLRGKEGKVTAAVERRPTARELAAAGAEFENMPEPVLIGWMLQVFGARSMASWGGFWRNRSRSHRAEVASVLRELGQLARNGSWPDNPGGWCFDLFKRFTERDARPQ